MEVFRFASHIRMNACTFAAGSINIMELERRKTASNSSVKLAEIADPIANAFILDANEFI